MNNRISILYVTRKHPPSIGGMQRLSYQFVKHISNHVNIYPIIWNKSQLLLPWFILKAFIRGLILAKKMDILFAGDPIIAPTVWLLALIFRKPTLVNVHGLDLTYQFPGYKFFISHILKQFTRIICISNYTYQRALLLGIPDHKCKIIYPGLEIPTYIPSRPLARAHILKTIGELDNNKQIWITAGRLVRRKGVLWFCTYVVPELKNNKFIYIIIGDGPDAKEIIQLTKNPLFENVYIIRQLSDKELSFFYAGADAFIMPNIPRMNDCEGFGLVAIEAASYHLPVIAARLEGIQEAVIENLSGYLLPSMDTDAWVSFLEQCLEHPETLTNLRPYTQDAVSKRFNWDKIVSDFMMIFKEILNQ